MVPGILLKPAWDFVNRARPISKHRNKRSCQLQQRTMTHTRNVVSNGACLFCLLYICLLCIELDIFCLGHQRLSLRLDTSDSSKEGLCCNLCAPLVVESHLQANSWAERHQASGTCEPDTLLNSCILPAKNTPMHAGTHLPTLANKNRFSYTECCEHVSQNVTKSSWTNSCTQQTCTVQLWLNC